MKFFDYQKYANLLKIFCMKKTLLFISFWAVFANIQAQPCTYLAYESFAAPANSPLHGSSSGSGWLAAWDVQGANTVVPGYQIQANSLSYNALQTVGMSASGGNVYLTAGRRLDANDGGAFDDYVAANQTGIGTQTGTELWISCLIRKDMNNQTPVFMALHDNNVDWCESCTSNKLSFGYFGASSEVGGQQMWSLRVENTVYPSSQPIILGTSAFFVAKISFTSTGTNVDCYINPISLGNNLPASPTLSQTSTTNLIFRNAALYLGNSAGNGAADEIRMATSYGCVAPDNTIFVDLPPLASFTMSQNSGTSPVTVNLDGSASADPENGALTYTWNFGDGTPLVYGQTVLNHTFSPLGILNVALTVTDPNGQSHTQYKPLTVYNSGGYYPCNQTFTLVKEADCGQSNGILRVNNPPATFSLLNSSNVVMPLTGTNEFQNLPTGTYIYMATSGAGGCKDTFHLYIPTDSLTCAGWQPSMCSMDIGVNLSGLADWARERPFRNLFLHVRPAPIPFHDNCNCWDNGTLSEFTFDSARYPIEIPQTTSAANATYLRYVISSNNANLQQGKTYVLLYDGVGDISIQGDAVEVSNTPNRIEFNVTGTGNIWFHLNSSQLGNHVRNIRMLRLADEFATDLQTQPFYSVFLEKITPLYSLRFMDWGHTNASPNIAWQNRPKVSRNTYAGDAGVPYEKMIQLANIAQKHVWICVPHAADDNYITKMAELFRDNLNPSLTIYLEYSNEVWNWMFEQAHYNENTRPSNLTYGEAYAEKAKHIFQIWHQVFGIQKNRVQRVLGLQGGYNGLNEQILSQIPQSEWDLAAPTFYYGLDHGNTGNPVLNASSTPLDVLQNSANNFANFAQYVHQDYRNAHLFGKKVVNYEGGQHFTNFTQPPYLQAMYDAQVLPEMYTLYDNVLDSIRIWGSKMAMAFTLAAEKESIYGSWGHLEDIDQDTATQYAPKYQALMDNMANHPIGIIDGYSLIWANMGQGHYHVVSPLGPNYTYLWSVENGFISGDSTLDSVQVYWNGPNGGIATLYLTVFPPNGCPYTTKIEMTLVIFEGIEQGEYSNILVYPNPATESLTILQKEKPSTTAFLLNAMGQMVKTIALSPTETEVNVAGLAAGVYVLRVGNVSKRVVIAH